MCQKVAYPGIVLSREMYLNSSYYFEATTDPLVVINYIILPGELRYRLAKKGEKVTCLTSKTQCGRDFWKMIDRPARQTTATVTQYI